MMNEKKLEIIFVIALIILGIFYMFLAYGTQMLGEDEDIYLSIANNFAHGIYPALQPDGRQMNLPTLFVPSIYSLLFSIFGFSLGLAKVITALFGILTVFVVYLIGKRFNIYYGIFSAILLLSIQMFTSFMMLAYVEVPIAFFSALLLYMFLSLDNIKKSIITGMVLGLAFYTKSSALLLVGVLIIFAIYLLVYKKDRKFLKLTLIALIIFAVMLAPFMIRNLLLYKYPYIEGLNIFFGNPPENWPEWLTNAFETISPVSLSLNTFSSSFGWLVLILCIFGFSYMISGKGMNKAEQNEILLLSLFILGFISVFSFTYFTGIIPLETRYLSIIFPQIALLGGFFLWKLKEWKRLSLLIIALILFISIYFSLNTALATNSSQRYSSDYLNALKWIKSNTANSSIILTTYTGSLGYYGERVGLWAINIKEFPELMTTNSSSYIYETLKHYNVSYILVWGNTVAQNYIVPESNLFGVYTYNFVNVVSSDKSHFNTTYQNQNNIIFKLI